MKLGFNAHHLSNPALNGWNRYSVNLIAQLASSGIQIILYGKKPFYDGHLRRIGEACEVRTAPRMPNLIYEQVWLARQCQKDQLDVFHSPFNSGLPWFARCATVLNIHDVIDEKLYDRVAWRMRWSSMASFRDARIYIVWRKDRAREHIYQRISRARADKIITGSQHAKADIIDSFRIPAERVSVIHHAADSIFSPPVSDEERRRVRDRYGLCCPYVFYVGSHQERKNVPFLIRAFADAKLRDVQLAVGGDPSHHGVPELVAALALTDQVKCLGEIPDRDLPALYAEAACFVYPSKYEGFGLQLCEAMAGGCPTLAADATSLPEVLGQGGLTFPLDSVSPLVELIHRIIDEPSFAQALRLRAHERSRHFSWKKCAEETINVYQAAMQAHLERHKRRRSPRMQTRPCAPRSRQ